MSRFETRHADWIPFGDALGRILAATAPLPPVELVMADAVGLAMAHEFLSPLTLPPGPTSHMDGYAVSASDLTVRARSNRGDGEAAAESILPSLRVVGTSLPGTPNRGPVQPGQAVRIMTGALLPRGTDTVVPVEDTDREHSRPGSVEIRPRPGVTLQRGHHVRLAGEEMEAGDVLARPGDSLGTGRLTLLTATGTDRVEVHPAPRVTVLVTGNEIVAPGDREALQGGVRRADLLSPTLPLLLRSAGAGLVTTHRVRDDRDELGEALERAAREADLILTTGGASMGEADLVKGVLDDLGWTPEFWRIRIRPGSPVSFGHLPTAGGRSRVPILGLPGNPVSAIVTTLVLALPAVRSLGGHRRRLLRSIRGTALEPLRGPEQLTRFFRVVLEPAARGRWGARLTGHQGSGAIRSIAVADGLAVLPEGLPSVEEGEEVEILLLPEGGWSDRVEEPA